MWEAWFFLKHKQTYQYTILGNCTANSPWFWIMSETTFRRKEATTALLHGNTKSFPCNIFSANSGPCVELPSPCWFSFGSHLEWLGSIWKHSDSKYFQVIWKSFIRKNVNSIWKSTWNHLEVRKIELSLFSW